MNTWSTTTNGTSTTSLVYLSTDGSGIPVAVATKTLPEDKPLTEEQLKELELMEVERLKKHPRYTGKLLTLQEGSLGNIGLRTTEEYLCVKQSKTCLHLVSITEESPKFVQCNLDLTQKNHYKVVHSQVDRDVFGIVVERYESKYIDCNESSKDFAVVLRETKIVMALAKRSLPHKIRRRKNLPMLVGDKMVLSKNLNSILSTYCEDNRKKATALCEQIYKEFFQMMQPMVVATGVEMPIMMLPAPQLALPDNTNKD